MASNGSPAPARILVVDDDATVVDVLRNALLEDGHNVECCTNATQALDRIANEHFAVVITDLRLPDGLGTEILNHSLRVHPQSAVIMVTGDSHFASAAEAVEQGAYAYIPKPFEPDNVRFLIRRALERGRLLSERAHFEELAMTDSLTSLGNRRKLTRSLETELGRSERFGHPLSLLMVDIDGLKDCNDRLGHAAGDSVIRIVAAALLNSLRSVDLIARYGGDEFAVLLPETTIEGAAMAAGRYCLSVASMKGAPVPLSVSIGRATYPDDAKSADKLLQLADRCMYRAKEKGGNRYYPE